MKTLLHIDDKQEWRDKVHSALVSSPGIIQLEPLETMECFRSRDYPQADLYVFDRHIPDVLGQDPNDVCWRQLVNSVSILYPQTKVLFLSNKPPMDWRNYAKIIGAINKRDFDPLRFRATVELALGLETSVGQEVIPYGLR